MLAQVLKAFGGADQFALEEVPLPEVMPGTVRVRLAATSVNPVDIKIRAGLPIGPDLPAILGSDIAGVIDAVGEGVLEFRPGDEVFGCAGGVKGLGGTLAQYIVADARLLARKPRTLDMASSAALPLVAITALDGIERAGVTEGEHVLVHGGVGGVGHIAVQLAKSLGATVSVTVSSEESAEIARGLGADEIILYRNEAVPDYVQRITRGRGFGLVFDTVGGDNLARSFAAAASEGRVVTTNSRTTQDLGPLHAKALSLHVVFMLLPMLTNQGRERHGQMLRQIAQYANEGQLRPLLDPRRFTLETAPDAHRLLESGQARGKVVIEIV